MRPVKSGWCRRSQYLWLCKPGRHPTHSGDDQWCCRLTSIDLLKSKMQHVAPVGRYTENQFLIPTQVYSPCHEHLGEYFCRAMFHPCNTTGDLPGNNNYQGYPCRETCYYVHHYCSKEVEDHLEFNTCLWYPSVKENITCFNIEVTCQEPEAPPHGSVEVEALLAGSDAQYDCHMFFDLYGDRVRTCQASVNSTIILVCWL